VEATIGPPLSPAQMVRWTGRRRTFRPIFRIAINPERPPELQIAHGGSGQKPCTNT
jgi:hypothetical protein